jgi:hypothetical protein
MIMLCLCDGIECWHFVILQKEDNISKQGKLHECTSPMVKKAITTSLWVR